MATRYAARRVLIADDEALMTNVLSRLVRINFQCEVVTCENGDDALVHLRDSKFDILLTDMQMPGIHGVALVDAAHKASPDTDIVVMTGYPNDFPFLEVIHAGASDFIAKPHPSQEICAKLLRIFKDRDARANAGSRDSANAGELDAIRAQSAAMSAAEQKYRMLFELAMNGMVVFKASGFAVTDVNRAFCDLIGRPREEVLGESFLTLLTPDDRERLQLGLDAIQRNGRGAMSDLGARRCDGDDIWLDMTFTFMQHEEDEIVLMACRDASEQHRMHSELYEMASRDALTGLLNHRSFKARVTGAIGAVLWQPAPLTLVFVDVDNFKQCNDAFGHQTGDAVLKTIGELLRATIRDTDDGFRYGGDEFAVLLKGAHAGAGAEVAQRLTDSYAKTENHGTSLSCGVAEYQRGMSAEEFIGAADAALYQAKADGKNGVCVA